MRQRRWLELIKDYDLEIHYHPRKANVVADALSRRAHCNVIEARLTARVICWEMDEIEMPTEQLVDLYSLIIEPTIKDLVIVAQKQDPGMAHIRESIDEEKKACFTLDDQGVLWFKNRLVVPKDMELWKKILDEAHTSVHPSSNKMYQDLKQKILKQEIAKYVSECDVCRTVKADHLKPAGMLQPLDIPAWKWEDVHMDFIVGLPRTQKGYYSIWVIIDRFTKSAHFLPVKIVYRANTYAELYIAKIVSLHGVPRTITSDRGSVFVSRFWEQLQNALGTKLIHSSAYHPQTSGQVERVNQIVEDMLRACALTYSTKWDECLPLAEFAYNNSYQKSLNMAPFEALYGRRCRTPLNWSEPGERVTFGPDLVTQAEEQVKFIQSNLKSAQSRQKSYSDRRRRPLVFEKSDHVYLRVSPMKGVHRFGVKGKLAPRYVGPFKITEKCGPVAYRLELPLHLAAVHDVFHVSQLKKCLQLKMPEEEFDTSQVQIEPDLTYEARPIKILDQKQRSTRRNTVNFYKVQWSDHSEEEATWETKEYLQTKHPDHGIEEQTQEQPLVEEPEDQKPDPQQEDQQQATDSAPEETDPSEEEFAYNNSYQKSLEMAPFEALYGERVTFGPDLVTQAEEQVKFIHDNLKRAQSRQKSYSHKRRLLVFEKDDHVYLKVSSMKGVHRFGVKGKLTPRYVGPFKIIEQCGPVAYRLELPPHLAAVHDVFHVSQLKKCLRVPEEVIDTSQIQIQPDLIYEEKPIKILDPKQRSTQKRTINFYKGFSFINVSMTSGPH
ncbi:hypothetical protein U9M48_018998 [Paspalum notatum var. saurae]|uniref:Integrase catalytic domain-containing protein n=1 Tax=Paspalum notatum var. saurae TaxID=547442 RepID=A0AAQ3TBB9_PASNO